MKVRIAPGATDDEASAIAAAMAEHVGDTVAVYVGNDDEPKAVHELASAAGSGRGAPSPVAAADGAAHDGLGPTERERQLREEIADVLEGGPEKYREGLADKLFVRDRLELWFGGEGNDFLFEDGKFAGFDDWHESGVGEETDDRLPADGLITGAAEFEGRDVHFMANDYTVKRGSMAAKGVEKFLRMQQRALKTGRPVLYLMDSSGGRIDQQTGFFANREGIGKYYYNHSMLSGRVPQICVLYGPCIAGAAYTPVFADFTIMVEDVSAMAIASPRMVQMVTGEEIDLEALGGPAVHTRESGSADLVAEDEQHARELVAQLITYLPDNADETPPRVETRPPTSSPAGIDSVVPDHPNEGYDMTAVIDRVVDEGSFFELRPDYGKEIITAYARIGGRPIGIVANQPAHRAGAIFPDAAEKAAEFIWKSDAFNVPILYLCDTPGFMAGSQVEKEGILEQGKKFIYATSAATVPQQTVVVRKAYGAGIYAMGGPAYDPESVIGLPSGEVGIMGPEAAINAVYARKLAEIDDPEERERKEQQLREEYREDIDVHRMASEVVIDEIVPPSTLREELGARFRFYEDVEKSLPDKKHGTIL
ncbi:acyl-CoA carboxylase subunit beta [Natronobacterium gregoryi]|uniref:Acetyl-CoA carboxylase, carboxyltransferase component (Subunits alpha and beta) n=2 Tax=Natronobacterium gregoryi TaxID=44930 RepID=L0AKP9_NATGS|nr:acyl-CoA carboxylase subunit beta [Natronobacterium gregoryi]AFZ74029.1 acetyl-CoA carboxylase, carboxyltransferase component (subunits alpha and beta) [Natronobacterium gregoryi SP2]ELY70600.1 protionyl-CoA carboxylase [Natronobacterium gregoryi SP2]PLK20776.1 acyl-CoA carboxylase subunit beta [Natronobacterium gregoryi SP2]SFJ07300.1 Acetyl-CoA carboxylase, carboxyltransferase component [Natronobacterium gregoryi]